MNGEIVQDWGVMVLRLLVAGLCGAVVGWEREVREKGAGLRTHTLICIGSCLFTLVVLELHKTFPRYDMMRLVHGLLLGIGFLAGGVIFTQRGSVKGLTTAAGLWVLTGVGLAVGFGYYVLAAAGTLLTLLITAGLKQVERRMRGKPEQHEPEHTADDS